MNKFRWIALAALVLCGVMASDAWAQRGPGRGRGPGFGRGNGQGPRWQQDATNDPRGIGYQQLIAAIKAAPKADLSADEEAGLLWMREEEKLAHDVYVTLGKQWKLPPLANIPAAEEQHMKAMGMLLERYGLEDPVTDTTVGVFQNQDLLQLYNDLIAQGEKSIVETCKVGALIEELDIADLQKLRDGTDNPDLQLAYDMLTLGSRNHLRAFARQLERRDATYVAQHLTQEQFDKIATSPHEMGWAVVQDREEK